MCEFTIRARAAWIKLAVVLKTMLQGGVLFVCPFLRMKIEILATSRSFTTNPSST